MRKSFRLLLGIASLALLMAMVAPVSEAQCPTGAREFASVGGGPTTDKMRIDPNGAHNAGMEIGRFWDPGDSSLGNNFDGNCPTQGNGQQGGGWWQLSQAPNRGVRGFISGTGCTANTCPEEQLTVAVEDWGPLGPPGINDTAYFIVFRVDRTAGAIRDWDFARTDRAPDDTVISMQEFPPVFVTAAGPGGGTVRNVDVDLFSLSPNVWGVKDPGVDTNLPDTAMVTHYDLMEVIATDPAGPIQDPGRDRSLWNLVASIPVVDSQVVGFRYDAPCDDPSMDTLLAVGLQFAGGAGPVSSALVGPATAIDCGGGLLADPEPIVRPGERPRRELPSRPPKREGRGR